MAWIGETSGALNETVEFLAVEGRLSKDRPYIGKAREICTVNLEKFFFEIASEAHANHHQIKADCFSTRQWLKPLLNFAILILWSWHMDYTG